MTTLADPQALADELGVDVTTVNQWAADLDLVAGDCLSSLDSAKAERALYYLTAYFIGQQSGQMTSESLGDASMSYAERKDGMSADPYGRMALNFAPCLINVSPRKEYGVLLVRP